MNSHGLLEGRITDALHLVYKIARVVARSAEQEKELISSAFFALHRAAEIYDESLGVPWTAFACARIRLGLLDALREESKYAARIVWAAFQAATPLGTPGDFERDDEHQLRQNAAEQLGAIAAAVHAHLLSEHTAQAAEGHEELLDRLRARGRLVAALDRIDWTYARIIRLHYMEGVTLRSIAGQLNVSYRTCGRQHTKAVRALERALREPASADPGGP